MKSLLKRRALIIITAIVIITTIISVFMMLAASRATDYKSKIKSSNTSVDSIQAASVNISINDSSKPQSSGQLSSTTIKVDVTQSKAAYNATNSTSSIPSSSKVNANIKTPSVVISSAVSNSTKPVTPPAVPASQENVTETIGNNTIRLNVNAFTFEAFVDWSSVQKYLLDDFYVKVYKNGILQGAPSLYGCVTKEPINTVAVEIDTYQSNGRWYIKPAKYTIECYCQLGEHSLVKENRPNIIPCPSATFTVLINERGFN